MMLFGMRSWRRHSTWQLPMRRLLSEDHAYKVRIQTGNRRGAGTSAQVFVQLFGVNAQTQKIEIDDNFTRDSVVERTIVTPVELGRIRAVRIGHDNVGDNGVGWYLESVELAYDQSLLRFPVRRWLGLSDLGSGNFPIEITLKARILGSISDPEGLELSHVIASPVKPFYIESGAACVPHPDKLKAGERGIIRSDVGQAGEDSYSIASVSHPDPGAISHNRDRITTKTICVADGVYSWRSQGIDAGEWSRYLTRTIAHQAQHHVRDVLDREEEARNKGFYTDNLKLQPPLIPLKHPLQMLIVAEEAMGKAGIKGSSTCCVASIHGLDNMLYVACLGDSGCCVYRKGEGFVFRTPEQEHSFGYPFQLGHHEFSDHASDALVFDFKLQPGDAVVVASDGLFDNMNESEMMKILDDYMTSGSEKTANVRRSQCSLCAGDLLNKAYANSVDSTKDSPWSRTAAEDFDILVSGGKKDDITVVVAFLKEL